jgi:hypothetical protein
MNCQHGEPNDEREEEGRGGRNGVRKSGIAHQQSEQDKIPQAKK